MWETVQNIGSGLANIGTSALDYLGKNKDAIGAAGSLAGAYFGYQAMEDAKDAADKQLALQTRLADASLTEQQRQITKENTAQDALVGGFDASGLAAYDASKKKNQDQGRNISNPYLYQQAV